MGCTPPPIKSQGRELRKKSHTHVAGSGSRGRSSDGSPPLCDSKPFNYAGRFSPGLGSHPPPVGHLVVHVWTLDGPGMYVAAKYGRTCIFTRVCGIGIPHAFLRVVRRLLCGAPARFDFALNFNVWFIPNWTTLLSIVAKCKKIDIMILQ